MARSKKIAGMGVAMAALLAIGGTFAYYTSTHTVDNTLETGEYGDVMTEVFTPDSNWEPGEEVDKSVGVTNTGDYDIVVRVSMEETWIDAEGSELISLGITEVYDASSQIDKEDGTVTGDGSVVYKALASSGWTYNGTDGYWYYNSILASDDSTGALLSSITLAEDTDMGLYTSVTYYAVTDSETAPTADVSEDTVWSVLGEDETLDSVYDSDDGKYLHVQAVSTITAGYEGYSGATYVLTITSETVQATEDAVTTEWGSAAAAYWFTTTE